MFSSLPKLADKTFVVAFLVPILAATLALVAGFHDLPWVASAASAIGDEKALAKLTALAAIVWFGAVTLLLANRPMYRLLEGYFGPLTHPWFLKRAAQAWREADRERERLKAAAVASAPGDPARTVYRRYLRALRRRAPPKESMVLPTRFGNANRAFESYGAQVYDVEAILIWPRLSAILPKGQQDLLADSRAQVNAFVNLIFLSLGLAAARALVTGVQGLRGEFGPVWLGTGGVAAPPPGVMAALLFVAGCLLVARLSYAASIDRVIAHGEQVKVTLDLYLPMLPGRLSYAYPSDTATQSRFWATLEDTFDFHLRQDKLPWVSPRSPPRDGSAGPAAQDPDDEDDE